MENFDISIIHSDEEEKLSHPVSEEVPLTIEVNGKELATLLCSPVDLEDMVTGFLYTSGFLHGPSSIKSMVINQEQWKASVVMDADGLPEDLVFKRIYTSGCGKGVIFHNPFDLMQQNELKDDITVHSNKIEKLMKSFLKRSEEHTKTRGVHSSALATEDEMIIFRDDIGRHNATDKIIGQSIVSNTQFSDKMILTSGRISSEIISKVLRCRCPVFVGAGAPTNQAVKLARSINLTLIGLARGKSMYIYSGEQRVVCP